MKKKSEFTKSWILENGIPIAKSYYGNLTIRALHYRLVAIGMTNDLAHYKKVVNAMIEARWSGDLDFNSFRDHERQSIGKTEYEETFVDEFATKAKNQIKLWATSYKKNIWENQPYYPEIFIEKKALQGVFERTCYKWKISLNPCKGYPSLTFLHDAKNRMEEALHLGKSPIILYFGDYDCSGENIPDTILENLNKMGLGSVELKRVALMKDQVIKWKLPPAPTKESDTRSGNWDGLGQVELDAVDPRKIVQLCEEAISDIFDNDLFDELQEKEKVEEKEFKKILKRDFKSLLE